MSSDDVNWFDKPLAPPKQKAPRLHVIPASPLVLQPARLRKPCEIPPRQWLYGTQLIRGYVTVLVAPGGTGKSAYAMAVAMSIASGIEFLGQKIYASVPVAVLNLEDPLDELDRRELAIRLRHEIDDCQLTDRFYLHSGEMRPVTIAALGNDGFGVVYPDEEAIITQLNEHGIGLLVVDPYAESHSLEENSNPDMVKAAAAWRRIARATNCAILLVHHVRKGTAVDIDAARGAKALTDSARVGLLMSTMSEDDAEEFGIKEEDRFKYVRLDDAKVNLAPRQTARWYHLDTVEIGNATEDYPAGDRVSAIVRWDQPAIFGDVTTIQLNHVLDRIDAATPDNLYSPKRGRSGDRWVGNVLMSELGVEEKRADCMVKAWLKSGLLNEMTFTNEQRKERLGVMVNHAKRPTG